MNENGKPKSIDDQCNDALGESNYRLRMDLFFTADRIRPIEFPDDMDNRLIAFLTARMIPEITPPMIGLKGGWVLRLRVVTGDTFQRKDG